MSILIKGMKMPEHCESCIFEDFGGCMFRVKRSECPLVEVPKPQNRPATWGDVFDSLKVLEVLLETIEAEEGEPHEQN